MTGVAVDKTTSHGNWTWEQTIRWLRAQPDQAALIESGYFDDPIEAAALRYWQSAEWRAISEFLPRLSNGRALDFGAGRGIASYALARSGFDVDALEANGSALVGAGAIEALAHQTGFRIRVHESTSDRLPFPDASFDLVFGRAVLHHVSDVAETCSELLRVLRPGGTLIAIREHVISRAGDLEAFRESHPLHKYYGGETAYTLDTYLNALRQAGFRLKRLLLPLRSDINIYPYSLGELQSELARRASRGSGTIQYLLRQAMRNGACWQVMLRALELIDNRPGRLYSFVARKP